MNTSRVPSDAAKAFTLLECLIYLALFSLAMQGLFMAFVTFSRTMSRAQAEAHVENEGSFALRSLSETSSSTVRAEDVQDLLDPADTLSRFTATTSASSTQISFTIESHDRSGSIVTLPFSGSWNAH